MLFPGDQQFRELGIDLCGHPVAQGTQGAAFQLSALEAGEIDGFAKPEIAALRPR